MSDRGVGSNAGSWDHAARAAGRKMGCPTRRGIKRGKLGSSRPGRGTQPGCPSAERDGTHGSWDQSARMTGRPVGRHEVRTYKCVCGDLLKFGLA